MAEPVPEPIPPPPPPGDVPGQVDPDSPVGQLLRVNFGQVWSGGEGIVISALNDIRSALGLPDLGDIFGSLFGGTSPLDQTFEDNVVSFEHTMNMSVAALQTLSLYTLLHLSQLGAQVQQFTVDQLGIDADILRLVAGQSGTLGPLATIDLPMLNNLINAQVIPDLQPLWENLGDIDRRLNELEYRVTQPFYDPRVDGMQNQILNLDSLLNLSVVPALNNLLNIVPQNLPQQLADEEACCAANTQFKNDWSDLLKALKPLFDLLKLLDIVALVALLEHLWDEGASGMIRELEGIIDDRTNDAESFLSGFLGL